MSHRMELREWYPQAERLLQGGRRTARGNHDCGDPGSLLLTRDGNEWTAYCFRCGQTGKRIEQESLAEQLARYEQQKTADNRVRATAELPEPRVYSLKEWPQADALWFYKMGLSPSKIAELGLYWCPDIGRVVLPIFEDGHAVYWTARAHKRTPKWLTPELPKRGLVATYGKGKGDTIVVCEDPLSAYMVGRCTEAWSLLGTKMHPRHVTALVQSGKRVATWMDNDMGRRGGKNPGQEAARDISARLRAFGVEVRNIVSPKDPKYYSTDYIREKLSQ